MVRLVWLIALTVAAVVGTTFLNRAYERMQGATAQTWYRRGEEALRSGKPDDAVTDLQTALVHDRDNSQYVLELAKALAATGKTAQAKAYFLGLWQNAPGDGEINLQLANIAVRENSVAEAERYFHGAIFGSWDQDPVQRRREVRLQLVEYLLAQGRKQNADAELIGLASELPNDPALQTHVGRMLLEAGDEQRALQEFEAAVRLAPTNETALAAAGKAAFDLGDFPRARGYLERALRLTTGDDASRQLLLTTIQVQEVNPFDRQLRYAERASRVLRAFDITGRRLESCAGQNNIDLGETVAEPGPLESEYQAWSGLKPQVTIRQLRANPDLMDTAANLALDIERVTATQCGPPTSGEDAALLVLARNRVGR